MAGFNFGAFAGGAAQGAEKGVQTYQQLTNFKNQQQLKADLKTAPQVGDDNTSAGPKDYVGQDGTKYAPDQVSQQAVRQGNVTPEFNKVTPQDRSNYIQNAVLADTGNVDLASRYALQGQQANYYGAETQGKTIQNTDQQSAITALNNIQRQQAQLKTMSDGYDAGKVSSNDIMNFATQNGVQIQGNKDGTIQVGGHTLDPNNANDMKGLLATASHYNIDSTLRGAGIQGNQIANQNMQSQADQTRAGATAEMADTQRSIAPSEIQRNQGQAAQSNATANTLIPAEASRDYAGANAENAQAGLTNTNNQIMSGFAGAEGAVRQGIASDPNFLNTPQGSQAINTLKYSQPASIYGSTYRTDAQDATRLQTTQMNNNSRVSVAQIRAAATGTGRGAQPSFRQDAQNPNIYHDTRNPGRSMVFDQQGNLTRVNGLQAPHGTATDPTTGLPAAQGKDGTTGYLMPDGSYTRNPNAALSAYAGVGMPQSSAAAGTNGTGQNMSGAGTGQSPYAYVNNPPLVNGGYPAGGALPGYQNVPGLPTQ